MKNIQGIKLGNVVNISINGRLHKKNCGSPEEAKELFALVLKAKEDPCDSNIRAIRLYINDRIRIALVAGLEADVDSGEVYLAGFNTPVPETLVNVIKEYHEDGYPIDAIINFWKLLMINPDKRIRTVLFDFIKTHDFVLTDSGYMLVYKAVAVVETKKEDDTLKRYVFEQYTHVKTDWKCSPNKYMVYQNLGDDTFGISKRQTVDGWDADDKNIKVLGLLGDLNADMDKIEAETETTYTDKHTQKMVIKLGEPVKQKRKECDADFRNDCSNGLHCGSTKYVSDFADDSDVILTCLVNPMNVVAIPEFDHSKMRVCEYFPIGIATYENGKIEVTEQLYFENDYKIHEEEELNKMIAKVKKQEKPIDKAMKGDDETRPMSELLKILEGRMVDI